MSPFVRNFLLVLAAVALMASETGLAYFTPREHTAQLLALFAAAVLAYLGLLRLRIPLPAGLALALGLRLLWLLATPELSDDFYRFRWDGLLVAAGQNPYAYLPAEYVAGGGTVPGPSTLTADLFYQLNSPRYYSVYPPVCQAAFGLAAWAFPSAELGFVVMLRLLVLLAELGSACLLLALLRHWRLPAQRALWYLLHPMVIAELIGNLHPEAFLVTGLLLAFFLLARGRWALAAAALGAAVAAKLTPLLLLPLLVRRLSWRQLWIGTAVLLAVVLALFYPFATAALAPHFFGSLDLYFHRFEFNASLYYVLRAAGYWLTGYNEIARLGTVLALATLVSILVLAGLEKRPTLASLPGAALLAFTIYFALSTTVHPWYLAPLVALSCLAGWRFAAAWLALAAVSYATYGTAAYQQDMGLIALEYLGVVLVAYGDFRRSHSAALAT